MELVPYTPEEESGGLDSFIRQASARYDVPEGRLRAVIDAESAGRTDAVSPKGAQGLMQLMPATAKEMGVTDPMDQAQNIDAGARYLKQQYDRFGNWDDAHAAYNAGPARVARGGELPKETRDYVQKISAKVGADEAPGLTLHPYEPSAEDQSSLTLHPYEPVKEDPSLASRFADLAKIPTKVVGEGAAFMGGIAPMVATYLSYAVNRAAGADPDQAHDAAMEARQRVDPGQGLEKLTEAAGVDKDWVQSPLFRNFMEEFNEKWIQPASEAYFPAQTSLAKTAFEDVANVATFAAAGAGAHAAKGKIIRSLPESMQPRVIEDKFEPQPAAEAAPVTPGATPAPAEQAAGGFTDPNAQARAGLVEGVDNPLPPPETTHADVVSPAEPIMKAQSLDEAIDAAEQALAQPMDHVEIPGEPVDAGPMAVADKVLAEPVEAAPALATTQLADATPTGPFGREPGQMTARELDMAAKLTRSEERRAVLQSEIDRRAQPETVNGPAENRTEIPAKSQLERAANDHGSDGIPQPAEAIRPSSAVPENRGDHQPGAAAEAVAAQPVGTLPPAEVAPAFRDYTAPKTDKASGIIKGQVRTFDTAEQASAFAKQEGLKGLTPRESDGTYVLSRPPLTDAQKANVARLADTTKNVQPHDSLNTMLRKWGGINAAELIRDGADRADVATSLRFAYRNKGGLSLDAVAERMAEQGFDVYDHGMVDSYKARELLQSAIDGNEVYTPEGMEIRKARAEQRKQAGLEPTREEMVAAGLDPADISHPENVSMVAAAAERNEAHVERLVIQYADDHAGFLRAVKEFLDDDQSHETTAGGKAGVEAPAEHAPEVLDKAVALKRIGEAADAIRTARPEDIAGIVSKLESARRSADAAGATPHEIMQSMETPKPPLTAQQIADVLRKGSKEPERRANPRPETPAPAGVSHSGRSIDQVPPALLNRIKVSVEQFHEGEGIKTIEVPAKQAIADIDSEISAMRKLLECVGL